jgi:hypothetical protein
MREITIGEKQIRIRATPLALLYYRQEFKADLVGDLISMQEMASDPSRFDSIKMLQLIWAMNKADKPEGFPSFEGWLSNLDSIDFGDGDMMTAAIEEAEDGFFRGDKR